MTAAPAAQGCEAGVLVLTGRGHVPIESVRRGDVVLTHRNRWRPVERALELGPQPTVVVRGSGHYGLRVTPGCQLYVRADRRPGELTEARWRAVSDLADDDRPRDRWAAPTAIPPLPLPEMARPYPCGRQNHLDPAHLSSENLWWLVGLFGAEGSTGSSYGAGQARNRSVWSLALDVEAKATAALDALGLNWYRWQPPEAKVVHVVVNSATLTRFLINLTGHRAPGKHLHPAVFGLPAALREAVWEGAITGDGWRGRGFTYTTVSRSLAFDMRLLALSLGLQASVEFRATPPTRVIQGRKVRCRDLFRVQGCEAPTNARFRWAQDMDMAFGRVLGVKADRTALSYDLITRDRSYVAEGVVLRGGEPQASTR